MRKKQRLVMHYVHIAGPETYKAAIMIAKMLNDILYGKVVVFHLANIFIAHSRGL